jgi:hypothetical protein
MDISKVSQGQLIAGAGGILLFISLFLNWAVGQNAWNFSFVDIWMLLIAVAAAVYGLAGAFGMELELPAEAGFLLAGLGMAAFGWAFGFETEVSGNLGVWLAILGSLGIAFGGFEAARSPLVAPRPRRTAPPPPPPTPAGPPTP